MVSGKCWVIGDKHPFEVLFGTKTVTFRTNTVYFNIIVSLYKVVLSFWVHPSKSPYFLFLKFSFLCKKIFLYVFFLFFPILSFLWFSWLSSYLFLFFVILLLFFAIICILKEVELFHYADLFVLSQLNLSISS